MFFLTKYMIDGIGLFSPYLEKVHKLIDKGIMMNIVFVGIDRYSKCYSNIPFCKKEWGNFYSRTAGTIILKALGFPVTSNSKDNPTDFFENILLNEKHIAFINLSYTFNNGKLKSEDFDKIKEYYIDFNQKIIYHSENIVLCGIPVKDNIAKIFKIVENNKKPKGKIHCFYHPSARLYDNIKEKYYKEWGMNKLKYLIK